MELVTESVFNYYILLFALGGFLIGLSTLFASDDNIGVSALCATLGIVILVGAFPISNEARSPEHVIKRGAFVDTVVASGADRGAQTILTEDYHLKLVSESKQTYEVDGKTKECIVKAVTPTRVEAVCNGDVIPHPSDKEKASSTKDK